MYRSGVAEIDTDTFSAGQHVLEEKLPAVQQAVQKCREAVQKAAEERREAWAQWKAAHDESGCSRLLQQHMKAEHQLQRALDSSIGHMQVRRLRSLHAVCLECNACHVGWELLSRLSSSIRYQFPSCSLYHIQHSTYDCVMLL